MIPAEASDTRAQGLIDAHHIVADVANELPKVRWWQLGRKKYHQMVALLEVSERLYVEITRIHDARFPARPSTDTTQERTP